MDVLIKGSTLTTDYKTRPALLAIFAGLFVVLLAGCGGHSSVAASGPVILSATAKVPSGTAIPSGSCFTAGVPVTGATAAMGVLVSAASDPTAAGLLYPILISGFVDAPDHVTVKVCKLATPSITATADLTLNIKVVP